MVAAGQNEVSWYRRFRSAAYASAVGSLFWTAIIVVPFPPFSYLPPIIVGGGPGTWFILAYLLLLTIGVGGLGAISSFLHTIELHEKRSVSSSAMWPAYVLLVVGLVSSCVMLALAGAIGGYASTIVGGSENSIDSLLSPYVYPITASTLVTVLGAALALSAMVRARWPAV